MSCNINKPPPASLGLAYFTYTFVLRLTFFPFMNVLAVVIAIGVGADDTFILSRVWSQKQVKCAIFQIKKDTTLYLQSSCLLHPAKLEACLGATLHHALLSMLVTSATTAARCSAVGMSLSSPEVPKKSNVETLSLNLFQ